MALASSHEKVIERVASKRIAPELRRIRNIAFEARPQAASEEPEVAADNGGLPPAPSPRQTSCAGLRRKPLLRTRVAILAPESLSAEPRHL